MTTKNEQQWADAMATLYDALDKGDMPLEKAEVQANVCGKALKALALGFSREVFSQKGRSSARSVVNT